MCCFYNSFEMNPYFLLLLLITTVCFSQKPNILLIVTDDQAPHTLSCYGNKVCETPNLDKLASSGMVLDQSYHMGSMSGAVCSPSRTMIMSGRTLWHLPPRGKKHLKQEEGKVGGQDILNNTLPAVFNRAGYETLEPVKKGTVIPRQMTFFRSFTIKLLVKQERKTAVSGMVDSY